MVGYPPCSLALLYYHGLVAVGLGEGRLLLLDLALDEVSSYFCFSATLDFPLDVASTYPQAGESSDSSPAGVFYIRPGSRDIAR